MLIYALNWNEIRSKRFFVNHTRNPLKRSEESGRLLQWFRRYSWINAFTVQLFKCSHTQLFEIVSLSIDALIAALFAYTNIRTYGICYVIDVCKHIIFLYCEYWKFNANKQSTSIMYSKYIAWHTVPHTFIIITMKIFRFLSYSNSLLDSRYTCRWIVRLERFPATITNSKLRRCFYHLLFLSLCSMWWVCVCVFVFGCFSTKSINISFKTTDMLICVYSFLCFTCNTHIRYFIPLAGNFNENHQTHAQQLYIDWFYMYANQFDN